MDDLRINRGVVIAASDLKVKAVRASGPGGQNVNKVSSKVELRFDIQTCNALDDATKTRLRQHARNRLDAEGQVVITSQLTRNQPDNLRDARDKLVALIIKALHPPKPRRATKPSRAAKQKRLNQKRQLSEKKKQRSQHNDD